MLKLMKRILTVAINTDNRARIWVRPNRWDMIKSLPIARIFVIFYHIFCRNTRLKIKYYLYAIRYNK